MMSRKGRWVLSHADHALTSLLLRILQGTSKVCASKSTTFQRTQTTKRTPQSTSSVSDNGVFISLAEGSLKLFLLRLKGQAYAEPWLQLRVGNSCSLLTGQLRLISRISPHTSPPPGSHPLYHAEGRGGGPCLLGNIPQFYREGAFSSDAGHGTEQEFRKHFPNNYKTSRQWRCACTRETEEERGREFFLPPPPPQVKSKLNPGVTAVILNPPEIYYQEKAFLKPQGNFSSIPRNQHRPC